MTSPCDPEADLNPLTRVINPEVTAETKKQIEVQIKEQQKRSSAEEKFLEEFRTTASSPALDTMGKPPSQVFGVPYAAVEDGKFPLFEQKEKKVHFFFPEKDDNEDDADLAFRGSKMKAKSTKTKVLTREDAIRQHVFL